MDQEKRLYLLRSLEMDLREFQGSHDLVSDSHMYGNLKYGPFELYPNRIYDDNFTEITQLTLRLSKEPNLPVRPYSPEYASVRKSGFYHGGEIEDEIIYLTSLFSRRRILPSYEKFSYPIKERLYESYGAKGWIDEQLVSGKTNLEDLEYWFNLLNGFDPKYHLKFIFAAKMYYQAINLIEDKPDIAYLNLVSAVEALCNDFPLKKSIVYLTKHNNHLKNFLENIEDQELKREFETHLLNQHSFISKKFVQFIVNYTSNEFWDRGPFPKNMDNFEKLSQISEFVETEEFVDREIERNGNKKTLRGILSKIYIQRSNTLHSGAPFQPHIFTLLDFNSKSEIPRHESYVMNERKWYFEDYIPYPHFFERLVNHVLKNFLKHNQI